MHVSKRLARIGIALLLLSGLAACGSEVDSGSGWSETGLDGMDGWAPGASGSAPHAGGTAGGRVTVWDHGLQMARGSFELPQGWQVQQDIATNPQTGRAVRYRLDLVGPQGELVRGAAPVSYGGPQIGQHFEPLWRQHASWSMNGALDGVQIGGLRPSQDIARLVAQKFQQVPGQVRSMEAELRGTRGGNAYAGRVYVIDLRNEFGGGVFLYQVVVAPPELLESAVQANLRVAMSNQEDPQYAARMAQINQRVLARMQGDHQQRMAAQQRQFDAHQQRMASNQAAFEAHQQGMRDQSAAFDASNQAWLENFRGSPTGASGSGGTGYTQNDQFVDYLRDEESFHDPYTGQRVGLEAGYDRTFTNGLGDFHQTNDAFFDPASMDGDWQQVQPMQPR